MGTRNNYDNLILIPNNTHLGPSFNELEFNILTYTDCSNINDKFNNFVDYNGTWSHEVLGSTAKFPM